MERTPFKDFAVTHYSTINGEILSTFQHYNISGDTISAITMAFGDDRRLTVFKTEFGGMAKGGPIFTNVHVKDEIGSYHDHLIKLVYNHHHTDWVQCQPQNAAGTKHCRITHYIYNEKVFISNSGLA